MAERLGFPKRAGWGHHEPVLFWFTVIEKRSPTIAYKKKIKKKNGTHTIGTQQSKNLELYILSKYK